MRRILCKNPDLSGYPSSYITADVDAGATTIAIENATGIAKDKYVLIGRLGKETSEIALLTNVSGKTLTMAALSNDHAQGDPVVIIPYNQIQIYSCATEAGTYVAIGSSKTNIDPSDLYTVFEHSAGTSALWYKYTLYNVKDATETDISDSEAKQAGSVNCYLDNTQYGDKYAITLLDLKNYLNIKQSDHSKDERLDIIRKGVIKAFEEETHYCLTKKTLTEYPLIENATFTFLTEWWPIYSITSIYNDDTTALTYDADPADSDYVWWPYGKVKCDELLSTSAKEVEITYVAWCGTDVPSDLMMALLDQMAIFSGEKKRFFSSDQAVMESTIQKPSDAMLEIIAKYRRMTI